MDDTRARPGPRDVVSPGRLERLADLVTTADGDGDGAREALGVEAPFTGDHLGDVPVCRPADVAAAVDGAREAQAAWADRPLADRVAVVEEFRDRVLRRRGSLLDLVQAESGKARRDALEEVLDVANTARYYARNAPALLAPERRRGPLPLLSRVTEHRDPVGVVGVIAPWNYPLTLAVGDALPALLAGNAVVLKPAEQAPFTPLAAVELLRDCGLPDGAFQVVTGEGPALGPSLVDAVDQVTFTGSTDAGRDVAARAGENLVDATLELGGKNPLLVLDDADLDRAVRGALRGAFANAGQLCVSYERAFVHRDAYDAFLRRFVRGARDLELGTGFGYGPVLGPLVSASHLDRVEGHVADAVGRGAEVVAGGRHRPDVAPYAYEPTVLTGVTDEMRVAEEETFGPVIWVEPVDGEEEAVARANASAYGLNAGVWTGDGDRGRRVARRVECGTVTVNDAYAAAWGAVDAPMGGRGDSGIGERHGRPGIERYTHSQTVAEQRGPPLVVPRWLTSRWTARVSVALFRVLGRLPGR